MRAARVPVPDTMLIQFNQSNKNVWEMDLNAMEVLA